jgi:hypothetical protein
MGDPTGRRSSPNIPFPPLELSLACRAGLPLPSPAASRVPVRPHARGHRPQHGPHGSRATAHRHRTKPASRLGSAAPLFSSPLGRFPFPRPRLREVGPASSVHVNGRGPHFELSRRRRKLGRASRAPARIFCAAPTRVYACGCAATPLTGHKLEGSSGPPGIFWE